MNAIADLANRLGADGSDLALEALAAILDLEDRVAALESKSKPRKLSMEERYGIALEKLDARNLPTGADS